MTDRGFPVNGYYVPELYARLPPAAVPEEDRLAIEKALGPHPPSPVGDQKVEVPSVGLAEVDRRWARRRLPESTYRARVELLEDVSQFHPGMTVTVPVRVHNDGTEVWPWGDFPPYIHLADRWYSEPNTDRWLEGDRSVFTVDIRPGSSEIQMCTVRAPEAPGNYELEINIVHELVRWFPTGARHPVRVGEGFSVR